MVYTGVGVHVNIPTVVAGRHTSVHRFLLDITLDETLFKVMIHYFPLRKVAFPKKYAFSPKKVTYSCQIAFPTKPNQPHRQNVITGLYLIYVQLGLFMDLL